MRLTMAVPTSSPKKYITLERYVDSLRGKPAASVCGWVASLSKICPIIMGLNKEKTWFMEAKNSASKISHLHG